MLAALIVVLFLAIVGGTIGQPAKWGSEFKVHLGLDLTSGTTVTLQASKPKGVSDAQFAADMTQAKGIMASRVNGAGFTEAQVQQQGSNEITVAVPGAGTQRVVDLVGQTAQLLFRQVLLMAPNTAVATPTPTPSSSAPSSPSPGASSSPSPSASSSATKKSGALAPAGAGSTGTHEMAARARVLGGAAAKPSASPSASASASASPSASATPSAAATGPGGVSTVAGASGDASLVSAPVKAQFNKLNCADKNWKQQVGYNSTLPQYNNRDIQTVSCGWEGGILYKFVLDKAKVLGKDIKSASATVLTSSVDWQTNLTFDSAGGNAFAALTQQMYSKYGTGGTASSPLDYLAVVLDGNVISFPAIDQGAITGGSAQITGSFSQKQATDLANVLNYGALPLTFRSSPSSRSRRSSAATSCTPACWPAPSACSWSCCTACSTTGDWPWSRCPA